MAIASKRLIRIGLSALALYCLLGFLVLPGIALHLINAQLAQRATLPASLARLEFNPFSLELTAFGFRLGAPDSPGLATERLRVDLAWSSLWRGLTLERVELQGPQVAVVRDAKGRLDALDWFVREPAAEDAEPATLPSLLIERLVIADGRLRLTDRSLPRPATFAYQDLDLELSELSTRPGEQGQGHLSLAGEQGVRLRWQGSLGLAPLQSRGHLALDGVPLAELWPYLEAQVPLAVRDGRLDVAGDYAVTLDQRLALRLSSASVALSSLVVDDRQGNPLLRLPSLRVAQAEMDLADRTLRVGELASRALEVWAGRNADGRLDWQALFADTAAVDAAAVGTAPVDTAATDEKPTATAEPDRPWRIRLDAAVLEDQRLHLSDRAAGEPVVLEVGPLDARLTHLDTGGEQPATLELSTGIAPRGQLAVRGTLTLAPLAAQLQVEARELDIRLAQPYVSPFVAIELRSGLLGGALAVDFAAEPLRLAITGQAGLAQLHTLDKARGRDLLRWQQLQVDGLDYRHPSQLSIAAVELLKPYARVVINPDLTTNLGELMVKRPTGTANDAPPAGAEPFHVHVGQVRLREGAGHFADFSLRPNFAVDIERLQGDIGTLDNRDGKAVPVSLAGRVDRYAPVSIKGRLDPFNPLEQLDITAGFERLELTTLTPYAAKFAGYSIRRGRLNLGLNYRIEQGRLNASHQVVVEQLQLGERVESPDAVDLPVRLAVALLKDSQGTISLDLPVQGNLEDPTFDVMPIVWQTLRNLVTRAAKAPFRFIGGLVGAATPELGEVPFAAGSSALGDEATKRLDSLAAALRERPALRLDVEGSAARTADGPPLAQERLEQAYRQAWYASLQARGERVPASADEVTVPEAERDRLLEALYRDRVKEGMPAEWRSLDEAERLRRMRQALLQRWAASDSLLRRLSLARASAIKDYLVDRGGLEDERIFILEARLLDASASAEVSTALHLDAR